MMDSCIVIDTYLHRFLTRYTIPRRLMGYEEGQADEMAAMAHAIAREMPDHAPEQFLHDLFLTLPQYMETQAWPTVHVVATCVQRLSPAYRSPEPAQSPNPPAPLTHYQALYEAAQRTGFLSEDYLYGIRAHTLIAQTDMTEEYLTPFRQSAYAARLSIYGEAQAQKWLQERLQQHAITQPENQ